MTGESTVKLNINPTSWFVEIANTGRLLTLLGMKHKYETILKLLTKINCELSKREEISIQLKRYFDNFEFVSLLEKFSKIFGAIDVASKYLKNEKADV